MSRARDLADSADKDIAGTLTVDAVDVQGTVTADENITIDTSSGGNGLTIQSTGDTSNAITVDANRSGAGSAINQLVGKWNGTDVTDIRFLTGSDTTNKDDGEITFLTSSAGTLNEAIRIDSSGRVGIATGSPVSKLDIAWGGYQTSGYALTVGADIGNISTRTNNTIKYGVVSGVNYSNSEKQVELLTHTSNSVSNTLSIGGAGNTDLTSPTEIVFLTSSTQNGAGGSEAMRIDSSGRLLLGTSTNTDSYRLQVDSAVNSVAQFTRYAADGADVVIGSSRGTVGSKTALNINDIAGQISFKAYQGTAFSPIASINAVCEAAPASGDTPGRLVFSTTADGASSPTERVRIAEDGKVGIGLGGNDPGASLDIANTTLGEQFRVGNGSAFRYLHLVGGATSISDVPNSEAMIAVADANFSGITGSGDTGFLVYRPRVDSSASRSGHAFFTGSPSVEAMRIDSSQRILLGTGTNATSTIASNWWNGGNTYTGLLNIQNVDDGSAQKYVTAALSRHSNNQESAQLGFAKSRGTTANAKTTVNENDPLGIITFQGADETNYVEAARITGSSDGTAGADDMPGRLVFYTTADGLASATERMRIIQNGFVGIGTGGSDPTQMLQVNGGVVLNDATNGFHQTAGSNVGTTFIARGGGITSNVQFGGTTSNIAGVNGGGSKIGLGKNQITFSTFPSTTNVGDSIVLTERMKIDTGGKLLVGDPPTVLHSSAISAYLSGNNGIAARVTNNAFWNFVGANTSNVKTFIVYGDGDVENTNNSYGAISDSRFKSDIVDASSQIEDVMAMKVRRYTLDSTGATHIGVIAQELEESGMSGLVKENLDGTKSVRYSVLYMKAVKALQEAIVKIESLEARVAQLEAN